MRKILFCILALFLSLQIFPVHGRCSQSGPESGAAAHQTEYDFGTVRPGEKVRHTFLIRNPGKVDLIIERVELPDGFADFQARRIIPPGKEIEAVMTMDTSQLKGEVQSRVIIYTNDTVNSPMKLRIHGTVRPAFEFSPSAMMFFALFEGETPEKSISLVNHEGLPLKISSVESESRRFHVRIDAVNPGREFKIVAKIVPDASPGRTSEIVRIFTNNPDFPELKVAINVFVKREVYHFPDSVNFGRIERKHLQEVLEKSPEMAEFLTQTVLVKRKPGRGKDFRISVEHEIPFLRIKKDPESESETYRLDVSLLPEKLLPGEIKGFLRVTTNDKDVPELRIPVTGSIE